MAWVLLLLSIKDCNFILLQSGQESVLDMPHLDVDTIVVSRLILHHHMSCLQSTWCLDQQRLSATVVDDWSLSPVTSNVVSPLKLLTSSSFQDCSKWNASFFERTHLQRKFLWKMCILINYCFTKHRRIFGCCPLISWQWRFLLLVTGQALLKIMAS